MKKHPDQIRWNRKYTERGMDQVKQEPSPWLIQHKKLLEKLLNEQENGNKAIDIACGGGRNSFYLADLGFEVEAVDISDVAVDWLKEKAILQNKSVFPISKDLSIMSLIENQYQVICNFYYLNHNLFQEYLKALAPEGLLFFETFTKDHSMFNPNMRASFCLDRNELLNAFRSLHILHYQEGIVEVEGGGKKAVAQLVATKL